MSKQRVTVTVDEELLAVVAAAVNTGRSESVSAWVSEAMELRRKRDEQIAVLAELVAAYEAEHGEITAADIAAQVQADRDAAGATRASLRRAG